MAVCIYHGSTRSWPRPKPRLGLLCVFVYVCVHACVCVCVCVRLYNSVFLASA